MLEVGSEGGGCSRNVWACSKEARLLTSFKTGTDTRQGRLTIGPEGDGSSPTVTCVSRRAWCIERCPPRSREASGSNPSPPTKTNLQILSHGDRPGGAGAKPPMDTDGHGSYRGAIVAAPIRIYRRPSAVKSSSSSRTTRECGRAGNPPPCNSAERSDSKRVRLGSQEPG